MHSRAARPSSGWVSLLTVLVAVSLVSVAHGFNGLESEPDDPPVSVVRLPLPLPVRVAVADGPGVGRGRVTVVSLPTGQALLTPFPDAGSMFAGWSGSAGCTGGVPCLILPPTIDPVIVIPQPPRPVDPPSPATASDKSEFSATAFFVTVAQNSASLLAHVNEAFEVGETLNATMGIFNTGLTKSVELYVGILRPDATIVFFTGQQTALGRLTDFNSFRPFELPPGAVPTRFFRPELFSREWLQTDLKGPYVFVVVALKAGTLADGVVTEEDIINIANAPFELR